MDVINSTARPRLAYPTRTSSNCPDPWSNAFTNTIDRHREQRQRQRKWRGGQRQPRNDTESGADITADQTVTGPLQAAFAGVNTRPRPRVRAGRFSHSSGSGMDCQVVRVGRRGGRLRKRGSQSPYDFRCRRVFISVLVARPYGTPRANASFDPVMGLGAGGTVSVASTRQAELVSARAHRRLQEESGTLTGAMAF